MNYSRTWLKDMIFELESKQEQAIMASNYFLALKLDYLIEHYYEELEVL